MGLFSFLSKFISSERSSSGKAISDAKVAEVAQEAKGLAKRIDNLIQDANKSSDRGAQLAKIARAKTALTKIGDLAEKYSFLSLGNLGEVRRDIEKFEKEVLGTPVSNKNVGLSKRIQKLLDHYAEFAFSDDVDEVAGSQFLDSLKQFEEEIEGIKDSSAQYSLAIAFRNYTAWFVRGDERKVFLEKCLHLLRRALEISPKNSEARADLGRLLIEEKLVRNLDEGIKSLELLKSAGEMPSYLNSTLSKAYRQSGKISLEEELDICKFKDPSPAVFREERKKYRALIRQFRKSQELEKLKIALNQYYNLAVLVVLCYKDHDCNSGVAGRDYDHAAKTISKVCKKIDYSYGSEGVLMNCTFISENDWKVFSKMYGDTEKVFDVRKEFGKYL